MTLRAMLAAWILRPKCRASAEESVLFLLYGRAVGTAAAAAAMAAALFGLSVFLFTENPLKCFIL